MKLEEQRIRATLKRADADEVTAAAVVEDGAKRGGDAVEESVALSGLMPVGAAVEAEALDAAGLYELIHGQTVLAAYDITILDAAGGEWQPDEALTVEVSNAALAGKHLNIYHLADLAAEAEYIGSADAADSSVSFAAGSFSVYVITEDQPSIQYSFVDPEGEEYISLRQKLYRGDSLVEPTAPSDKGKVFVQWVEVDDPGDAASLSDAAFDDWSVVSSIPSAASYPIPKYLKAVYRTTDEQVHISWYDQQENIIHQETVAYGTTVDLTENPFTVDYTASQLSPGEYLVFDYWTEDLYTLDGSGFPIRYSARAANGDIDLYAYCVPAHWLYFDGNKSASDHNRPASVPYTSPLLVMEGEIPTTAPHEFPGVEGYDFDGWWTAPTGGTKIYNADGSLVSEAAFEGAFYTGGASLDYDPTLYAHWSPASTASYSVAYYVQDPADAPGLADSKKTYIFQVEARRVYGAAVGSTASLDSTDTVANLVSLTTGFDAAGLTLNTAKSVPVTVRPDGSTVLNVYFDRVAFTLSFYHTQNKNGTAAITLYRLYGHDTSAEWPTNNVGTKQWKIFEGNTLSNTNFLLMPTMPAENRAYSDYGVTDPSANNARSFIRNAYMEDLEFAGSVSGGDYQNASGFTLDPVREDKRVFTGTGVTVQANLLASFDGFELVRLEGKSGSTAGGSEADYQWYNTADYKNPAIANGTDSATGSMTYFQVSGQDNIYQVNAYYVRHAHKLTLHYVLDGTAVSDFPDTYSAYAVGSRIEYPSVKYGADLQSYLYDYATDHENINCVRNEGDHWWFYDAELTIPVDFSTLTTMPDRDLVLYEGMRTAYPVAIDPAGGVLDGVNGSTWFNVDKNDSISEYTVTRDYVLASELDQSLSSGEGYFYRYSDIYENLVYGEKPRTANYVKAAEGETGEYVFYPGVWEFQYWYRVTASFDNDTKSFVLDEQPGDKNTRFDFSTAISGPVYLKARWARSIDYAIVYDAGGGARAPRDTERYLEGADAVILAAVDRPAGYQFRFWSNEPQPTLGDISSLPGLVLYPNESLTVTNELAPGQGTEAHKTVTLYAWYEEGPYPENTIADYLFYVTDSSGVWHDDAGDAPYYLESISPGEKLVIPETPADPLGQGRAFIGWYTDKDCQNRFEGFGVVGMPEFTKLYAGFTRIYTVTFKDENDATIITVQTYQEGDRLDARYVEYAAGAEQYVAFWSTVRDDDPVNPSGTTVAYLGKGLSFGSGGYNDDLTLYPVLSTVYTLSFNSQGGSYVAPLEMPRKPGRWRPAPDAPTRENYIFDGWWTAPAGESDPLSGTTGGVEYEFDCSLESFRSDNGLTDVPRVLYAHWTLDTAKARFPVVVNYWVQNPERTGYILYKTETDDNGGAGYACGAAYSLPAARQEASYGMAGYKTFDGDSSDDFAWFEVSSSESSADPVSHASTTSLTVSGDEQNNVCNVYYNRKVYTLKFSPDRTDTVTERIGVTTGNVTGRADYDEKSVTYTINGNIGGADPLTVTVWLGMDLSSVWPEYGEPVRDFTTSHTNPTHDSAAGILYTYTSYPDSTWLNVYYFTGWTEHAGNSVSGTVNNAFQNVYAAPAYATKTLLPNANVANMTYTLVAEYAATADATKPSPISNKVTVRYFLVDANGVAIEQPQYQQELYGIGDNGQTGADWAPDAAGLTKIKNTKASIPSYYYDESYNSTGYVSEQIESGGELWHYYYRYKMPNDREYEHYSSRGILGFDIIATASDFHDIVLSAGGVNAAYGEETGATPEGQYAIKYFQSAGDYRDHSNSASIYTHANGTNPNLNNGMGVTAFRSMLDVEIDPNASDADQYTDAHLYKRLDRSASYAEPITTPTNYVNLYYRPQSYTLTLHNGSYENSSGDTVTMPGGPRTATVPYTTYLSNMDGSQGYIADDDSLTPDIPVGYQFAYWSLSADSEIPFEGVMPAYDLELYAHYEPKTYSVTARGVRADGSVHRSDTAVDGRHEPLTDSNGVTLAWGDGSDFKNDKPYGTQLREFELPTPVLEPNELFYGWKRVLSDGSLATGYVSSTTQIVEDTVLVPDIRFNKGGYVVYDANGGAGTAPERDGGYYVGGSVKAKDGSALTKVKTVDGRNYTLVFVCWNTAADGSGTDYYPADTVLLPDSGELTLYAKYSEIRVVTLVYHLEGGTGFERVNGGAVAGLTQNYPDGTGTETVVKRSFSDYDKDHDYENDGAKRYPNEGVPASRDEEDEEFRAAGNSGYVFAGWTTEPNAAGDYVPVDASIRVNTLNALDGENPQIHLYALWAICKIMDGDVERPFHTLNDAVAYARSEMGGTATIQMLVDYEIPASDAVALDQAGDNITLTTAAVSASLPTGEQYAFTPGTAGEKGRLDADPTDTAILRRGYDGASLFTLSGGASLTLGGAGRTVILDGASGTHSCTADGGLVKVTDGTLSVTGGVTLRNSAAGGSGGAVYVASGGSLSMTGTAAAPIAVSGCTAVSSGGGVCDEDTRALSLAYVNFTDCKTTSAHGGMLSAKAATLTLDNCDFTRGEAGLMGGGVFHNNTSGTVTVTKCDFTGCRANGQTDDTPSDPSKGGGGGGLRTNAFSLTVSGSTFDSCTTAKRQGAAVFHRRQDADADDSTSEFTRCTFTDCTAYHGGAVESDAWHTTVTNCDFTNCSGTNSGNGGGLNVWADGKDNTDENTTVAVTGCTFTNCSTNKAGGGLRSTAHENTVKNCTFTNCTAGTQGGGLACTNSYAEKTYTTVSGCTFSGCTAKVLGGAIYSRNLTFGDSSVTGCSAPQGGAIYARTVTMTGGTITGNTTTGESAAVHATAEKNPSGYTFSGSPVIKNNVDSSGKARNVYLHKNTDQSIEITAALGDGAEIGVYVADAQYSDYGLAGKTFAKKPADVTTNLSAFRSDRSIYAGADVTGYGVAGSNTARIYWPVYIARVSTDGTNWTYHEYLTGSANQPVQQNGADVKIGAFDEANSRSGDVIVELLLEDATIDGTDRYTLTATTGTEGFTFNGAGLSSVLLRTTQDEDWNPSTDPDTGAPVERFTSTVTRGWAGSDTGNTAMFYINKSGLNFITEYITLDGNRDSFEGRAIYVANGSLRINGGTTVQNFYTSGYGGAVYLNNGNSLSVEGSSFSGCTAQGGAGGGVYASGAVTVTDSSFSGCTAQGGAGGGVYASGAVTVTDSSFSGCTAQGGDGGAVVASGNAGNPSVFTNTTFEDCYAGGNGGAIYLANGGSLTNVTIDGHAPGGGLATGSVNAVNGGAIYLNAGNLTVTGGAVNNCSATTNGGALWLGGTGTHILDGATIDGHASGGGLDAADPNAAKGGAIWLNAGSVTVKDSTIQNCSASNANGGAINVGGADARLYFEGKAVVYGNPGPDFGAQKNVVLDVDSNEVIRTNSNGLDADAQIGVYVPSVATLFDQHGRPTMDFGTYDETGSGSANLDAFYNDRLELRGEVDTDNDYLIRWSDVICKLTDNSGALLYFKVEDEYFPCVYPSLERGLAATDQVLYKMSGTSFSSFAESDPIQLQLLTDLTMTRAASETYTTARDLTVTTAETAPTTVMSSNNDTFVYSGTNTAEGRAVLTRGQATDSLFSLDTTGSVTFKDLCFDGDKTNQAFTGNGGAIFVTNAAALSLEDVSFKDFTATKGGAVYAGSAPVSAKGATVFTDCEASDKGGAVWLGGTDNEFEGVTVNGCSSADGAALWLDDDASLTLKGGEISGNSTSANAGGAVQFGGSGARLYLSGDVQIIGNTWSDGTTASNVYLDQNSRAVINTTKDGLGTGAKVGVYVTGDMDPETDPFLTRGGLGDIFGTYDLTATAGTVRGKENLNLFVNDRNGLIGGEGDNPGEIVWKAAVKVYEGEIFEDFVDMPDAKVTNDSAFTVRYDFSGTGPTLKFTDENGDPLSVPAGTTAILRVNDGAYYYYIFTSGASEVALQGNFLKMGEAGSFDLTGGFTAQFVVDFSRASGCLEANTVLNMGLVNSAGNGGAGTVTLVAPASFVLTAEDGGDLTETLSAATTAGRTVNGGRATIWDDRAMALVIENSGMNALPPDAVLKVSIGGGAETEYVQSASGKFIIPLGAFGSYDGIAVTLDSEHFPRAATVYTLTAKLMVADSPADVAPLNGTYGAVSGQAAEAVTLLFTSAADPQPSMEVSSALRAYRPGDTVTVNIQTLNAKDCAVTVTVYKKTGDTWASVSTAVAATTVKAAGADDKPSLDDPFTLSVDIPESDTFNSYKAVAVATKDDNGTTVTVLEVPYYFLAVKTD